MSAKPGTAPIQPVNPKVVNLMTDADLDRALSTESDSILPSSGFAASVMAAVKDEVAAPAPIPFPWKRALPGAAAAIVAAILLIAAIGAVLRTPASTERLMPAFSLSHALTASTAHHGNDALWIAASIAIPLLCLLFFRKLILPR